ncbi:MAG: hypothetical protein HDS39_03845 [Bacteroides sp.]|nr:hypothetical protein [Bacteroides sp.]
MKYNIKNTAITAMIWIVSGLLASSCEKSDIDLISDDNDGQERKEDVSGISFDLKSDTLEEDIEYVYFEADEWKENEMGANL